MYQEQTDFVKHPRSAMLNAESAHGVAELVQEKAQKIYNSLIRCSRPVLHYGSEEEAP